MAGYSDEEPVSPAARVLHTSAFNICAVVLMGLKTTVCDVDHFKQNLEDTFVKHPRFSSLLVIRENKETWKRTKVNIDNHVTVPDLDPDMESPDEFVEDYASSLSTMPLTLSRPLWEFHILNVPTSDAVSTLILRVHHSMGDGESLIALLLACTRKLSDPESLPTIPHKKKRALKINNDYKNVRIWKLFALVWTSFMIVINTLADCWIMAATLLFSKDTETPVKGPIYGTEPSPRKFVHRIVSLEDVKFVKNAMSNVTVNDVIVGVIQGGLSLYLERRYEKYATKGFGSTQKGSHLPKDIRCTATMAISHRPSAIRVDTTNVTKKSSKGKWGNVISYMVVPFTIALQNDPLTHIYQAKATIDRKKLSIESTCSCLASLLLIKLFGAKLVADLTRTMFTNTTFCMSNIVGPQEEVTLYGHPISYIAPSASGVPNALTMHWLSYDNKFVISLAVDENVIPDPHQLCIDFEKCLGNMKDAVTNKGLVERSFH